MANAKQCDVCGKFYLVPAVEADSFWEEDVNTSMVRILRRKNTPTVQHDVMQFDTCAECRQDVTDYILAKAAVRMKPVAE